MNIDALYKHAIAMNIDGYINHNAICNPRALSLTYMINLRRRSVNMCSAAGLRANKKKVSPVRC